MAKRDQAHLAVDPELVDRARSIVVDHNKASMSLITRILNIEWAVAVQVMALLEADGTVSKPDVAGKRHVLLSQFLSEEAPSERKIVAEPDPPTHHEAIQSVMAQAMNDIPGAIGALALVLQRGPDGRAVYILTATSHGDEQAPFGHVHAEDLLCEAITWNRVLARNSQQQQQEIEPAKAKQADMTPTSERAH